MLNYAIVDFIIAYPSHPATIAIKVKPNKAKSIVATTTIIIGDVVK